MTSRYLHHVEICDGLLTYHAADGVSGWFLNACSSNGIVCVCNPLRYRLIWVFVVIELCCCVDRNHQGQLIMQKTHLRSRLLHSVVCFFNVAFILHCFELITIFRVATHLENQENLEKSGNSKMVREKSGKMEKVREKSGKLKFAEELKLQLLAACGPGLWICSSLTLL